MDEGRKPKKFWQRKQHKKTQNVSTIENVRGTGEGESTCKIEDFQGP